MILGVVASQKRTPLPDFANVSSLLHFDGSGGSTTFTDQKGLTWSAIGNAQISTAQSKFGGSSLLLDGAGDGIQTGATAAFDFGTGDFTVEFFLYVIAHTNATAALLSSGAASWVTGERVMRFDTGAKLSLYTYEIGNIIGVTSFPTGAWKHVALCRSGTTMRLFYDGAVDATATIGGAVNFNTSSKTLIGNSVFDGLSLNGYVEEFRATKGVARYTSAFTPPTAAFPDA